MQRITILGAGMAGLLAGNMLQRPGDHEGCCNVTIYERQSSLPNNHSAVLRFRSDIVARALGIPFRKVSVLRATDQWRNPIADALNYSMKCNGEYRSDRSVTQVDQFHVERYIAPENLIQRMEQDFLAKGGRIIYDADISDIRTFIGEPIISTIPMPAFSQLMCWDPDDLPIFKSDRGFNLSVHLHNVDAYASMYISNPNNPISRISVTGSKVIAEVPVRTDRLELIRLFESCSSFQTGIMNSGLELLGLDDAVWSDRLKCTEQQYQKIRKIDEKWRRNFMYDCTDKFSVYSLGRFATWRPGLLLDDLVSDVFKIRNWIDEKYMVQLARSKK